MAPFFMKIITFPSDRVNKKRYNLPTSAVANMGTKKQQQLSLLAKLSLLVLYALFFMVQLFYNFDTGNQPTHASVLHVQKTAIQTPEHSVNKAQASNTKSPAFRLNKRYQPQPAVTCSPVVAKLVVCAVSSKLHIHYSRGFIPPVFPSAHALRGPPIV
jgi:hypothetical protein